MAQEIKEYGFDHKPTIVELNGSPTFWYSYGIAQGHYELASRLGSVPSPVFDPLKATASELNSYVITELLPFISRKLRASNAHAGFPDGHWYMVTITQKDNEDEDNIMRLHLKALEFFAERKIVPYVAALEHSNIWHVHYCCKFRDYKKNEQRDLEKLLKRRVQIEKRVSSLKQWNGLNKYIMKRGEHDKKDTSVRLLIERIKYEEGKGYFLID